MLHTMRKAPNEGHPRHRDRADVKHKCGKTPGLVHKLTDGDKHEDPVENGEHNRKKWDNQEWQSLVFKEFNANQTASCIYHLHRHRRARETRKHKITQGWDTGLVAHNAQGPKKRPSKIYGRG